MSAVQIMQDGALVTIDVSDPRAPVPTPAAPQPVSGVAILGGLTDAQVKQCALKDVLRLIVDQDVPATNAKLKRMALALGTTPDALRQPTIGG